MRLKLPYLTLATTTAGLIFFMLAAPNPESGVPSGPAIDPALAMPVNVAAFVTRSCADCHSNATRWPWYAKLRPISDLMRHDVLQARAAMNFSVWSSQVQDQGHAKGLRMAACAVVQSGVMPLPKYLLLHPEARPTPQDVRAFCDWTRQPLPAPDRVGPAGGR